MGHIVMGIGTSHSPMLSTPYDEFDGHAIRDSKNDRIPDFAGLIERNRARVAADLQPDVTRARHEETQRVIAKLKSALAAAEIDVAVIVGDDQAEWFDRADIPALAVYWGESVENRPPPVDHMNPTLRSAYRGFHGDGSNHTFPVDAELGERLVAGLTERSFEVHQIRRQPDKNVPFGHAWGFVHQRLMGEPKTPIVPVMLNTYFPPNQPTPARCWDLGAAINSVVSSAPDDKRVCVIGSGGLSHFVVDEDLDRRLLTALKSRDREQIHAFSTQDFQSGTSEARNWIVAGGACQHLSMQVLSYIPFHRSEAGTGVGTAFAIWS